MGRNILIVESKNDKYFFQSVIKHLNANLEVGAPIFDDEDYRPMGGLDPKKLTLALEDLRTDIQKLDIDRVGIIIDIDSYSEAERIQFINDCIIKVFEETETIDRVNHFVNLNFEDYSTQLACYFTNVDGQGELETVLKVIKAQDSPHADCLTSWRECLQSRNIEVSDKDFDKFWISNYVRFDTCSRNDKKQAGRKCTIEYALQSKPDIWNFNLPMLDRLKDFLKLFNEPIASEQIDP